MMTKTDIKKAKRRGHEREKRENEYRDKRPTQVYSLDTETSKDIITETTWVFSWMAGNIESIDEDWKNSYKYGTSIVSLVQWLLNINHPSLIYCHNLKFDLSFIVCYLERIGFSYTDNKYADYNEYKALVTDNNKIYSFELMNNKGETITFYDFYKICGMDLATIATSLHLDRVKGEYDYSDRGIDYEMTDEDWDYLYRDVYILGKAIKSFRELGLTKMTIGACAMDSYRSFIQESKGKKFDDIFPKLGPDIDAFCRAGYKGGLVFCMHPEEVFYDVQHGDYNSAYPAHMRDQPLPYGKPKHFKGKYRHDPVYPLYIVKVRLIASVKEGHVPGLIKKDGIFSALGGSTFKHNEDPMGDYITLTSVDIETLNLVYDVERIEYIEGYKFKASTEAHFGYVDYWVAQKIKGKLEGNAALTLVAKFMLNSITGKFGGRLIGGNKRLSAAEGILSFIQPEETEMTEYYVPFVAFITAYQRNTLIKETEANYPNVLYGDTDSIFVKGKLNPVWFDEVELGAIAIEHEKIERCKFIRAKTYYLEYWKKNKETGVTEYKREVVGAGMSKKNREDLDGNAIMSFEEFAYGLKTKKLTQKQYWGGTALLDGAYELKRIGGNND